jgi:hypothetical protein
VNAGGGSSGINCGGTDTDGGCGRGSGGAIYVDAPRASTRTPVIRSLLRALDAGLRYS